jgi:hypothetical protein
MAGRIRSIKPEILEDEKTAALSHLEWRLFVSLWLLADDFGNLRGDPTYVLGQTLWAANETRESVSGALDGITSASLLIRYMVRGQTYYHICGWSKHQKVSKPGKPRMPGPDQVNELEVQADIEFPEHPGKIPGDPPNIPEKSQVTPEADHRSSITDLRSPTENSPARDPVVPSIEHETPTVTVAEVSVTKMLWGELETARLEAGAELGVEVQQLPFGDDGERLLAERVVAARKRGAEDLDKLVGQTRHAIEMAKQETISREKPFEWFSGAVFSLNNFRRLVAKTTADLSRAGPRDHSRRPESKPRKSTDLTPPPRPTPESS